MSSPFVSRTLYALAMIANFVLTAFAIQLGAGKVPIPPGWEWTIPLIAAAVTGAMMFLPRAGSEPISMQVDRLQAQGYAKREMIVVPDLTALVDRDDPHGP